MINMRVFSILFCTVILAIGCAATTVDYNYDPSVDFESLKTYEWFPIPRINVRHDLLIKQIKNEIQNQLQVKAISRGPDKPDFYIALHGGFQSRMDYMDWEYLYEHYRPYWAKRRIDVTTYEANQLIIDIIDVRSRDLIYRATATAFIPEERAEERDKTISESVAKILINFPPGTSSEMEEKGTKEE